MKHLIKLKPRDSHVREPVQIALAKAGKPRPKVLVPGVKPTLHQLTSAFRFGIPRPTASLNSPNMATSVEQGLRLLGTNSPLSHQVLSMLNGKRVKYVAVYGDGAIGWVCQ